jgi:hypothetical protein
MYSPMFKLKNNPLTKSLGPFFQEKWSKTTRKQGFFMLFFFYHFEAIRVPQNGPKKVNKGPPVGMMYGPMSKLKNKSLTKLLGPFF